MANFSVKLVFDRKKTATNTKKAAVQIQVCYGRTQWFYPADVHVFRNQWDATRQRVRNSAQQNAYNALINEKVDKILEYYQKCVKSGSEPQKEDIRDVLSGKSVNKESFVDFCLRRIDERTDITESSKKSQCSQVKVLKEYGKIRLMSDITYENIVRYSEWLQKKYTKDGKVRQGTVWTRLKCIKHYVKEAYNFDLIEKNPFDKFKIDRGESVGAEILLYEDFLKMMSAPIPPTLEKVRDILAVQFYTGLSIVDLKNADFTNLEEAGEYLMLTGERQKTHQKYYIPILEECLAVLKKHDFVLPMISDQQLNMRYRLIAECAGVKYHISTHSLRKGCATYLINKGVRIEVISKVMGHATTKETEKIYAKLNKESIAEAVIEPRAHT